MSVTLYLPATYQAGYAVISVAVWNYLDTHPGSTIAQIAAATEYSEVTVARACDTLAQQHLLVQGYDGVGALYFWKASQYEALIVANLGAARSWVINNDGGTTAQMATALGVHYGIARALSDALFAEGSCKLLYN